jgi:hypothetical protein
VWAAYAIVVSGEHVGGWFGAFAEELIGDHPGDDADYRLLCRDELMAGFRAGS